MSDILVTGAAGFIGAHLARRLLQEGLGVRLLVDQDARARVQPFETLGAQIVIGDCQDVSAVFDAAMGCDAVYHLAELPYGAHAAADYYRANVDATEAVVDACERAHVHRLVYLSSHAILSRGQRIHGDETFPYAPYHRDVFAETKAVAERAVLDAMRDGRVSATIIRPGWVWGSGDDTALPQLLRLARTGLLPFLCRADVRTTSTHVDNLAAGLRLALHDDAAGDVFFITDDVDVSPFDLAVGQVAACTRAHAFRSGFQRGSGHLLRSIATRLTKLGDAPPPQTLLDLLAVEQVYSCARAKRKLGYAPVVGLADGMTALREWAENNPAMLRSRSET